MKNRRKVFKLFFMKAKDILSLTEIEINERIRAFARDALELKLKKQVDGSKEPSSIKWIKKDIARLKTILRAKQAS